MIKYLTENEYNELLQKYSVVHFMGGCRGIDNSATIYLVNEKIILVSNDETEKIAELQALQLIEAKQYFNDLEM